jgi:HAD superfamily hydrolase (TIGR01509 family)
MPIKNIIFDLGGVILNIDLHKTAHAFTALGVQNFNQYFTMVHADPLFKRLETGAETDAGFYEAIRKATAITCSDRDIDAAWNAMLLDFPPHRIEKLKELSKNYRLFLFSNTNAIHHAAFSEAFRKQFGFEFDSLFEKAWYSHLVGHRKPEVSAFEAVLKLGNISAAEALFIDDTLPNIEGARRAGLQAAYLPPDKDIEVLLKEVLDSGTT